MTATPLDPAATPDELAARLFSATVGAIELLCIHVGDQLGFYRLLHEHGSATPAELAARAGTNERATREWLEQQATAGFLVCDNPEAPTDERRFRLPPGHEAVFVDPDSLLLRTPFAQLLVGLTAPIEEVVAAFRSGGGVPYARYGTAMHEGQARSNLPAFTHQLAQEWIAAMPDVAARLASLPPARVADVGVGQGWSSIALARAFPHLRVDGLDLDPASVAAARANAQTAGVADRVAFAVRDAGDPALAGRYDLALAIQCLHDMANPVAALDAMRRLVGPGGTVLIVDERVPDAFAPIGDEGERMTYGFSVLHCLPVGMSDRPSAATGAVMRRATFRGYAAAAGFARVDELPIESDVFRFYRLTA
jgi:SAM-dependent methyltransferase